MKRFVQNFFLVLAMALTTPLLSQTDTVYSMPPLTATTTGLANFTFEVSSTSAINIKRMATAWNTAGNVDVWYRVGGVQHSAGQSPVITAANGWIFVASVAMTSSTTPQMIPYLFNIPVNPGTPVGIYFGGSLRYNSTTGIPDVFTDNTLTVDMTTGKAYAGGTFPNVGTTPRKVAGWWAYEAAYPCTTAVGGTTTASNTLVCVNGTATLNVTGSSGGSGTTYQWQSSTDSTTWGNIIGQTSPVLNATVATTTFYRRTIICGVATDNSIPVKVTTTGTALATGTYTINGGLATSGNNFNNFADFQQALTCGGISGPIVINVINKGSSYAEQLTLGTIGGTSAINTIVINGNGQTITSGGGSQYGTVLLNGASYITIKNLKIEGSGTATNYGLHITGGAANIMIDSCEISINQASTLSTTAALVVSGSLTSPTLAGTSGTNITVKNSVISGGYYGVTMAGLASSTVATNNVFENNIVRDFYLYGSYFINQPGAHIKGNDINRANRAGTLSTFYGIVLNGTMNGTQVLNNRIHNPADQNPIASFTSYPIYMTAANALVGQPLTVANNAVYNINGVGLTYGIYLASGAFIDLYHNTISIDNSLATTATTVQRALFVGATTSTFNIKNNLFSVTHGGTGVKHVVYFSSTAPTFSINNNHYNLGSSMGTNSFGYWSAANVNTFTDWQAVNSGAFDQNGVYGDPIFDTSAYKPQSSAGNNAGANLLAIVPTDITGAARTATPDPGVIEYIPLACLQPTSLSGSSTSTSITINWSNDPDADSVSIEYGGQGFVQGTGTFIYSTDSTIIITGLASQTCYDFYLKTWCGGSIGNGQALFTYCTQCGVKTLPLTENFDGTPAGTTTNPSQPQCWKYINTSGSTSVYGYNYTALAPLSPLNHWRMYAGVVHTGVLALASPALDGLTAGNKRVKFWAKSNTTIETRMFVGTMANPDLASTITIIDTVLAPQAYTEFTTNITTATGYNGTDEYVVFILGNTATGQSLYIDDILIEQIPLCNPPTSISVPTITATSAQVAWTSLNGTCFDLEYGPQGFIQGTGNGTLVTNVTTPYTITGLSSNTNYQVYVRDCCNPNAWAGPFDFKTNCLVQLNGTYTVGGTAGPTNFATLDSAINTLTGCGVTGPVTFNLQGGTYNISPKTFATIVGVSATNTVTFNGGGPAVDTIAVAGGAVALTFDGAQYITFQNLSISAPAADRQVWMWNATHHITFNNCHILGSPTATLSTTCVMAITGTSTSISSTGNNANDITVTNCKLVGGYYGFSMYGTSTTTYSENFTLTNNVFENQYYYGIRFYYAQNINLEGNDVKVTRNTATYGLYAYYNTNLNLKRNQFFGFTYGAYVYYLNQVSTPTTNNEFSNNFFGGGTYGLYNSTYSKVNIWHNSFRGTTSGYYGLTPTDVDIRNNIFVGGTSYAFYNSTNPTSGYVLNYNLYYATGTNLAYNGAAFTSLAAWQTAQSGYNANSLAGDPGFLSNLDFHIIGTLPNDVGQNGLATIDIDNQSRPASGSTIVDIGADEFTPLNWDASAMVISEPQSNSCGDSATTVKVVFSNLGLSTITSLSATVNVTGSATATLTGTYTGNLPTAGVDTVTVGTLNTIAGGSFNLEAVMSLTGDQNSGNDTLLSSVTINDALIRTPLSTEDTVCAGDFAMLYYPANASGMSFNWLTTTGDTISSVDSVQVGPMGVNDTTFVLRAVSSTASVGPIDNNIGASANYTAMNHYMLFTVNTPTTIYSVDVVATSAGLVDVVIQDGTTLATLFTHTVAIPAGGLQTVVINQPLPPGNYRMGGTTVNNAGGLQRNSAGAVYPYIATDNSVTITGNTFGTTYYYFFYNWQLGGGGCPRPDGLVTIFNKGALIASFAPLLNAPTSVDLTVDFDASASIGATSYDWDFGDGTSGTGMNVSHTYLANGSYTVQLVIAGACGTDTITQTIVIAGIGIEESLIGQTLNLYPNPNDGKFRVEFQVEGLKNVEIRVMSLLGQTVYQSKPGNVSGSYREEIDLSSQTAGVYILQVISEDGTVSRRVTVRK
jgi:parallel beta-helix repeat protein